MSKVNKHEKQNTQIKDYYAAQTQLCIREIAKIKQACIESDLIKAK